MKDKEKEEYRQAANLSEYADFPYFVRWAEDEYFSKGDVGFGVMHWHDDLQFIYVLEGQAIVKTLEAEVRLCAGEGCFTNKGVIHYSLSGSRPCRYFLIRFPERLLTFYTGSPAEVLTSRITENRGVGLVIFRRNETWCQQALEILQNLARLEADPAGRDALYKYEVLTCLCRLWLLMLQNITVSDQAPENATGKRMRLMLEHIEENYSESITLEELASSAAISKSEALRCFQKSLQTTPGRYLMDLRLAKAADMLKRTDRQLEQIAGLCGFNSQSYFGKCFKEKFGVSPKKYRLGASDQGTGLHAQEDTGHADQHGQEHVGDRRDNAAGLN